MKGYKKGKSYAYLVMAIGAVIYLVYSVYYGIANYPDDPVQIVKVIPDQYINLFSKEAQRRLIFRETWSFKSRAAISFFTCDEKYDLEITEISKEFHPSLYKSIVESYTKPDGKIDYKIPLIKTEFTSNYKIPSIENASKIYVSLIGDSVVTILKDRNVAEYYLKLEEVYVQYQPDGDYEILINANTKFFFKTKKPTCLMFLKRGNSLYFLILTTKEQGVNLRPGLLNDIIISP